MTQDERNKLYIARFFLDGKMTISKEADILDLRTFNTLLKLFFLLHCGFLLNHCFY